LSVGDSSVGKTCLLHTHLYKEFPPFPITTTLDSHRLNYVEDNKQYLINFYEIGDSIYRNEEIFNPKVYPDADFFVICYSITSESSFKNIKNKVSFFKFFL
jgi:cell division control protein 42